MNPKFKVSVLGSWVVGIWYHAKAECAFIDGPIKFSSKMQSTQRRLMKWEKDLLEMQVRDGRITSRAGRKYTDIVIPPGSQMDAKVIRKLNTPANSVCRT